MGITVLAGAASLGVVNLMRAAIFRTLSTAPAESAPSHVRNGPDEDQTKHATQRVPGEQQGARRMLFPVPLPPDCGPL